MKDRKSLQLGPWPGGMNTRVEDTDIADTELALAINVKLNPDGSLSPRPGFLFTYDSNKLVAPVVDVVVYKTGLDLHYLFLAPDVGDRDNIYVYNPVGSWEATQLGPSTSGGVTDVLAFRKIIIYNDSLYLIGLGGSNPNGAVYKASSISAVLTGTATWTKTSVAALPDNNPFDNTVIYRDRVFLACASGSNVNRVWYSKATDPTVWASPDGGFFDIPGDEGANEIKDMIVYNDALYIFKTGSSWVFRFSSDPGSDGVLQNLSQEQGASSACVYNNRLFVVNTGGVWEISNYQWLELSEKLNLNQASDYYYSDPSVSNPTRFNTYNEAKIIGGDGRLYVIGFDMEDEFFFGEDAEGDDVYFSIWPMLVYDLRLDAWVAWAPLGKLPIGDPLVYPVGDRFETNFLVFDDFTNTVICQNNSNNQSVTYCRVTESYNDSRDPSSPDAGGFITTQTYIRTKRYRFSTDWDWKQFIKLFFDLHNWHLYLEAAEKPYTIQNILTLKFWQNPNVTVEQAHTFNLSDSSPENPVSGFMPFIRRRFRQLQISLLINSSATEILPVPTYWPYDFSWRIHHLLLDLELKTKYPERVP